MSNFQEVIEAVRQAQTLLPQPADNYWEPVQSCQYDYAVEWLEFVERNVKGVSVRSIYPLPDGALTIDFVYEGEMLFSLDVLPDEAIALYFYSMLSKDSQKLPARPNENVRLLV